MLAGSYKATTRGASTLNPLTAFGRLQPIMIIGSGPLHSLKTHDGSELTGVMAYGPRKDRQTLVEERGGLIGGGVSKKVHYLVVGSVGNEQWRQSTYGTKIMKAVELPEAGASIAIVGEDHWQKMLFG